MTFLWFSPTSFISKMLLLDKQRPMKFTNGIRTIALRQTIDLRQKMSGGKIGETKSHDLAWIDQELQWALVWAMEWKLRSALELVLRWAPGMNRCRNRLVHCWLIVIAGIYF